MASALVNRFVVATPNVVGSHMIGHKLTLSAPSAGFPQIVGVFPGLSSFPTFSGLVQETLPAGCLCPRTKGLS